MSIKRPEDLLRPLEFDEVVDLLILYEEFLVRESSCASVTIEFRGRRGSAILDDALLCISADAKGYHLYYLAEALSKYKIAKIAHKFDEIYYLPFTTSDIYVVLLHEDDIFITHRAGHSLIWTPDYRQHVWYNAAEDKIVEADTSAEEIIRHATSFKCVEKFDFAEEKIILDYSLLEKAFGKYVELRWERRGRGKK